MFGRLFRFLFGEKVTSTASGIAVGALTGAATIAASGNLTKEGLIAGAAGGALSALAGAAGRVTGEGR
ncbi:MAG: hypothetical protein EOM24_12475 [Chloroflexia bacterium]|nr:hypothetical protein [Chloroflexia bacterium]